MQTGSKGNSVFDPVFTNKHGRRSLAAEVFAKVIVYRTCLPRSDTESCVKLSLNDYSIEIAIVTFKLENIFLNLFKAGLFVQFNFSWGPRF